MQAGGVAGTEPWNFCCAEVNSLLVIAHRGASAYAPENTYAAFDLALHMGAPAVETDIQLTRDGVLVLAHDAQVDRTTDGHGAIRSLSYAELAALDAGSWFAPRFAGERVPRLTDFLDRYGRRVQYALEIKDARATGPLVAAVTARGLLDLVTFTSFSFEICCEVRSLVPEAAVGFLYHRTSEPLLAALAAAGMKQACPNAAALQPAHVQAIRAHGLAIRTWGVKDETVMRHVVDLGVDGTTVDFPDRLLRYLAQAGHGGTSAVGSNVHADTARETC